MNENEKIARDAVDSCVGFPDANDLLPIFMRAITRATEGLQKELAQAKLERSNAFTTADMMAEALRSGYGLREAVSRWNSELAEPSQGIGETVIEQLRAQLAEKDALLKKSCEDWADDHTRLQALVKQHVPNANVEGDSYGVPGILDLAEMLAKQLAAAKEEKR